MELNNRQQFEKALLRFMPDADLSRYTYRSGQPSDIYNNARVRSMWIGWELSNLVQLQDKTATLRKDSGMGIRTTGAETEAKNM